MATATADPETGTEAPADAGETGGQADGAASAAAEQQQLSLLPDIDGRSRTRLRIGLGGTLELEPHDIRDAELAKAFKLGEKTNLELIRDDGSRTGISFELLVATKGDKARQSNDGYIEDVVHTLMLRVLSISYAESQADREKKLGR